MTINRALAATTLVLTAAVAAVALAACGSSSSGSTTASAAAATGSSTSRAKLQSCLKQHGVTLPTGFGKRRPGFGSGNGGPPPGGGTPPAGSTPPGGGTPPGGRSGTFPNDRGGGHFDSARSKKLRAAFKACGANFGGHRPGGAPGGGFKPSAAALQKFSACVKQHGYTLPKPNTSGNGPIFPRKIESDKKFQTASRACASDLRPSGGGPSVSSSGSSD
jgi:hypothetical protein